MIVVINFNYNIIIPKITDPKYPRFATSIYDTLIKTKPLKILFGTFIKYLVFLY
jgi:hypothetical protein